MFEQSLYNQEAFAPPAESHEGDLFYKYEIKNWDLTPRIYKILGIAAISNLLFLGVVGQTNLLTRKGCDSPITATVCQVIDTAVVATTIFGTKRDYIDAVYEKTELADADVTFVDVSNEEPKLEYPEGYFALANPEEFAMLQQQAANPDGSYVIPGTSSPTANDLFNTKPIIPKANPDSVVGKVPDGPLGPSTEDSSTVSGVKPRKGRPGHPRGKTPDNTSDPSKISDQTANTNTNTNPQVTPTDPVNAEEINKRPFKDLGKQVNDLRATNQIDLGTPFLVNAKGKLTKDGKLDPKSFKFVTAVSSDENQKMIQIVKDGIAAISDSGYLNYLKDLSGKDLDLVVKQDELNLTAVVQSELESDTRARSIRSALEFLINLKKGQKESPTADQNDKDDLLLLQGAKVEANGKKIIITFEVPKEIVQQMILRKLDELAKEPPPENGNTEVKTSQNTAQTPNR